MKPSVRSLALVLVAAAFAAGCVSDEKLNVSTTTVATPLLARYVSMGNSIAAGMQSAGINDSTQREAYPVLLAQMAGVPFTYPSLAMPGCPPPFTVPLGPNRVGNGTSTTCFLRQTYFGLTNNVAVPGEYVADLTNPLSPGADNPLSTFINGGLSEAQAMAAQQPTFVSLWAPNNDILNAVNLGDTTAAVLTPLDSYVTSFTAAANAIKAVNPLGAALIGVVDVPDFAPIVQPGAFFFAAYSQDTTVFGGKHVDVSCAPFNPATGQANPFASNLVSFHAVADPTVATIRCTPDAKYVTTTSVAGAAGGTPELPVFEQRIADINAAIEAIATSNGWIFLNPNTLDNVLGDADKFRKCQGLATATPLTFAEEVAATCPGPTAPNYFGSWVSLDATHPSLLFHQAMAAALAQAINATYKTNISTTPPATAVFAR